MDTTGKRINRSIVAYGMLTELSAHDADSASYDDGQADLGINADMLALGRAFA